MPQQETRGGLVFLINTDVAGIPVYQRIQNFFEKRKLGFFQGMIVFEPDQYSGAIKDWVDCINSNSHVKYCSFPLFQEKLRNKELLEMIVHFSPRYKIIFAVFKNKNHAEIEMMTQDLSSLFDVEILKG